MQHPSPEIISRRLQAQTASFLRPIKTARAMVFIYGGLGMADALVMMRAEAGFAGIIIFSASLFLLALAYGSLRHPYVSMLVAMIVLCAVFVFWLYSLFQDDGSGFILIYLIELFVVFIQVPFLVLVVRGFVFALRLKQVKSNLRSDD